MHTALMPISDALPRLLILCLALGCRQIMSRPTTALGAALSNATTTNDDLAWNPTPSAWHQQIARIVDHRFSTFAELRTFATNAKKAGVSVLMLVQLQSSANCPGDWYNGLQLCDHINGLLDLLCRCACAPGRRLEPRQIWLVRPFPVEFPVE